MYGLIRICRPRAKGKEKKLEQLHNWNPNTYKLPVLHCIQSEQVGGGGGRGGEESMMKLFETQQKASVIGAR